MLFSFLLGISLWGEYSSFVQLKQTWFKLHQLVMSKGFKTFAKVHIAEAHQEMQISQQKEERKMKSIWNERNM
jgi:hypothetical protein